MCKLILEDASPAPYPVEYVLVKCFSLISPSQLKRFGDFLHRRNNLFHREALTLIHPPLISLGKEIFRPILFLYHCVHDQQVSLYSCAKSFDNSLNF